MVGHLRQSEHVGVPGAAFARLSSCQELGLSQPRGSWLRLQVVGREVCSGRMVQEHVQHKHPLLGVHQTWIGSFLQPRAVWWFCVYGDFYSPVLYGDYAGFAFLALLDPMCHPARVGSFLTVFVLMVRKTIVIECPLLTTLCG